MKFYDLTLTLSNSLPTWPNDTKYERTESKTASIKSKITLSTHFGTHIDAPKHFLLNNKNTVDKIDPSKLIGVFTVVEIKSSPLITLADVKKIKIEFKDAQILFKTKNSKLLTQKKFTDKYVSLSLEAAEHLVKQGVVLVGTDYFGIEAKGSKDHPVHKLLLGKGVVIVEGLDMSKIKPGKYDGAILPLKLKDAEAAPARAVLWSHN